MKPGLSAVILGAAVLAAGGCDNMQHQQNVRTFAATDHFADGAAARATPAHTIAQGETAAAAAPTLSRALLERGRVLYNADCAPCHGEDGYGEGIVVRRGFPSPGSLHTAPMRQLADRDLYATISQGSGRMYPMADRLAPADRWAVVDYLRALQLSQDLPVAELPPADRRRLAQP